MIKVDGEVYAAIQARAQPFVDKTPNDVLRRELLNGVAPVPAGSAPHRKPGALRPALGKGILRSGDVLVCSQPRRKRTFRAVVTSDGWIALTDPPHDEFDRPSPALRACTGGQINGWANWIVQRTGKPLQDYRY
jgi:hypothetical protein